MIQTPEDLLEVVRNTPSLTDEEISLLVQLTTNTILLTEFFSTREELIQALEEFFLKYPTNEKPLFIGCNLSVKN